MIFFVGVFIIFEYRLVCVAYHASRLQELAMVSKCQGQVIPVGWMMHVVVACSKKHPSMLRLSAVKQTQTDRVWFWTTWKCSR